MKDKVPGSVPASLGLPVCGAIILIISVMVVSVAGVAQDTGDSYHSEDWVVEEDQDLVGGSKKVRGDMVVQPGVHLRIHGTDLSVGGKVVVHEEATLRFGPHQGKPTTIGPYPGGAGFWFDIRGTLLSQGTPRSVIQGLHGSGLDTLFDYEGGIQVQGIARLGDVDIMDGDAGIVVQEGGALHLHNATLEELDEIAVGVFGTAVLERTRVVNHTLINVVGRATCDITIRHSELDAIRDGVVANSCPAEIHDTVIRNPGVGITVTGSAQVAVTDSRIENYRVDGISVSSQPDKSLPRLSLKNVEIIPGLTGQRGLELMNAGEVFLHDVYIRGNELVGVQSSRTDLLTVVNSRILANEGYGILAAGGHLDVDLESVDFGSVSEGTTNRLGAVQYRAIFQVLAKDGSGHQVEEFEFEVLSIRGEPVYNATGRSEPLLASFPAFVDNLPEPLYLGPFTYRATHLETDRVVEGELEDLGHDLVVLFPDVQESGRFLGSLLLVLLFVFPLSVAFTSRYGRERGDRPSLGR